MGRVSKWSLFLFGVCFFVSFFWWFPLDQIKGSLIAPIRKQTGVAIRLDNLKVGSGLGLGLTHGGLLGIKSDNLTLLFPGGKILSCKNVILSPHFLSLFTGKISVGVGCELNSQPGDETQISSVLRLSIVAGPFWNPQTAGAKINLTDFSLSQLSIFFPNLEFGGVLQGEITVNDLVIGSSSKPRAVSWNISGKEILTPAIANDFVGVPAIPLESITSKGRLEGDNLVVEDFKFGSGKSPLEGDVKINFKLDPIGQPISGEILGKIRTQPDFEAAALADKIPMDLVFGKVRPSGFREFKKTLQGNLLSLLLQPAEELPAP